MLLFFPYFRLILFRKTTSYLSFSHTALVETETTSCGSITPPTSALTLLVTCHWSFGLIVSSLKRHRARTESAEWVSLTSERGKDVVYVEKREGSAELGESARGKGSGLWFLQSGLQINSPNHGHLQSTGRRHRVPAPLHHRIWGSQELQRHQSQGPLSLSLSQMHFRCFENFIWWFVSIKEGLVFDIV